MSDGAELIARAKAGDDEALEQLIDRCAGGVRAHLERITGARLRRSASVSDLEQEVWLRSREVLARLPQGAGARDFENLLHTHVRWILGNAVDQGRRFEGETAAPHALQAEASSRAGDGTVTRADERAALDAAVDALEPSLAAVVRLRGEGLTWGQIGAQLAIGEDAARKRFVRAAKRLRERLGPSQDEA